MDTLGHVRPWIFIIYFIFAERGWKTEAESWKCCGRKNYAGTFSGCTQKRRSLKRRSLKKGAHIKGTLKKWIMCYNLRISNYRIWLSLSCVPCFPRTMCKYMKHHVYPGNTHDKVNQIQIIYELVNCVLGLALKHFGLKLPALESRAYFDPAPALAQNRPALTGSGSGF